MQMNSKKILTIIYILLCSSAAMFSQNMLINGDFESGGSGLGFIVNGPGYTLINPPYTGTVPGNYTFATDPQVVNPIFVSGGDHTSGTGKMLIIDATTMGGSRFWRPGNTGGSICGITIGTVYTFSFWVKSISTTTVGLATQPNIGFFLLGGNNVNPANLNTVVQLPAAGWQKVLYTFTATSTCINIELFNNNTSAVGNDFAVDDFYLAAPPLPVTLSESFSNPTCQGLTDGTITASASYGTAPYNFTLTGPVTQTNTTGFFTGLAPGTYGVSVTDSAPTPGTVTHSGIVLVDPPGLTITASNTSICNGSSTNLSVSGSGLPVQWTASPADPSLTTPNSTNPVVSPTQTTTYTAITTALSSVNLIANPDFSAGNTGFTTDYTYLTVTNPGGQQGTYGIAPNSQGWFAGFSSCNDHTGGGNMYVSDGSIFNGGNDRVWCQTVTVIPGADYTFSYWSQNVASGNPANLDVVINGTSIGASLVPTAVCSWVKKTYIWNSGSNTSAQICLYDRVIVGGGNDFAIDDISFMAVPCSLSKSITINVTNTVNLTITDPPAVCSGTINITLPAVTAGSTSGTTLTYWTDSTATSPLGSPSAIAVGGTYYIKSTLGSCSIIKPVVVTISGSGSIAAPVVTTPLYLCQGSTASALTATALPGATLNWYGTNATGGAASSTAPIPSTATLGTTTYYVSQTVGTCEGPRAAINVIVTSGTGIYNIFCDPSQATTTNSVFFDWSNIAGLPHVYTISYSINGGTPVIANTNLSSYEVFGVAPGESVFLTIVSNLGAPCVLSESYTCSLCTTTTTPIFASIPASICSGSTAPVLPLTSDNGISGTWLPATVSNTTAGSYVFTPDPTLFPCASGTVTKTIAVAAPPSAGTLSGTQSTCVGSTTTFTSTIAGGRWTSLDTTIASVNALTGVITGVAVGTTTITYTVTGTGGCADASNTRTITIVAPPNAGNLTGTQAICIGSSATYTSDATGGTWSTSNGSVATVSTTGLVTGVSAGTADIIYTMTHPLGCTPGKVIRTVTVTAPPTAGVLSGTQNTCVGSTTTFSSTIASGNWTSLDTTIATVNISTGVVTGIAVGTTTITYTVKGTGGCADASITRTITVVPPPVAGTLSGNQTLCEGATVTFSSTSAGGQWTTSDAAIATVNINTGLVTGIAAGTATITYTKTGSSNCANATATRTITVTSKEVPLFNPVNAVCSGTTILALPTTSTNGYTGTWSPAINNTATTTYTFTPTTGQCATTAILTITITQKITPQFDPIAVQCHNNPVVPVLPTVSTNGVTGTWSPAVSLATIGTQTYTFTPNTGECVTATVVTLPITVVGITNPNFTNINLCSGKTAPTLSTISPNGVEGTWSPAVVNNTVTGTYLFTPNTVINQCATPKTITVTIIPRTVPNFPAVTPFCVGTTAPILNPVSPNGINGTWLPAVIDNTIIGTSQYVFTPISAECATTFILDVTVTEPLVPDFANIDLCLGITPPVLGSVSPNGIVGTWAPAVIDNTILGTTPYLFTPNAGECGVAKSIDVTVNEYTLTAIEGIVSNYFDDLQIITVLASGPGDYLYQLDHGPKQESNIFQDVPAGLHTVTAYDRNNCGPAISDPNILVINYPKFFTPNADGLNDRWNIFGLSNQPNSRIYIFDRYGKLLKEISPAGEGWDGTYNGNPMPGSDYWFSVDYLENNLQKQFKSHFSIKR